MFNGLIVLNAIVVTVILFKNGIKIGLVLDSVLNLKIGNSLACSGVCLTIINVQQQYVELEAWQISLSLSNLSGMLRFDLINVEQPMKANALLHGHAVSGHIISVVKLTSVYKLNHCLILWFRCPHWLSFNMSSMASLCLNGVSLTLVSVRGMRFSVHLIRHSVRQTSFRSFKRSEFNFE